MLIGVLYVLIGVLGGLSSGLLGIGGSVIIIPLLVVFLKKNQLMAQGIALSVLLIPLGIFAGWWHYFRAGHINWLASLLILVGFMMGAYLGGHYAMQLPIEYLKKGFAILLLLIAVKLFYF